ncbi:MAG TPA: ROK family protein [Candidatus Eremiobacteraceae bacterium]|nr:ROK family protein [Candidatus Eremiobacteraceae bacterium]
MKWAIGVDLGGTHVAAAPVDERGRLRNTYTRELEAHDVKYVVGEVAKVVDKAAALLGKHAKFTVGVGSPGNIEERTGIVRWSPNFGWQDVPLRDKLEKKLGHPVRLLNDARCATIGEYLYGVGKGARDFVLITLGTGIGGGIVANGKLLLGHAMGAGEMGHHVIRADTGFICTCGKIGCFEAQASGTALLRHALALAPSFPRSTLLTGTPQADWGSKMISRAAAAGDLHAVATWNAWLRDLACGVANIIAFLNPEIIALGGGVGRTDDTLLAQPLTKLVDEQTVTVPKHQTTIVRAKLGNEAGIVGAGTMALHGIP